MRFDLDPTDLAPLIRVALVEVLAERDRLGDTERLGYPEPEAARLLGLAAHQLRDARRRGEITGRRIGRSVVYSRSALLAWLDGDGGRGR
jgi:hypothetical protein